MTDAPARPPFDVIHGDRDMIAVLEAAIEQVKAGQIDGLAICSANTDGRTVLWTGWRDDVPFPWSRIFASVSAAQHELMVNGL